MKENTHNKLKGKDEMALFGRKSITEIDVATRFIDEILPECLHVWSEICDALSPMHQRFQTLSQDKGAAYEFSLAVIAIQMRALPNLLASDQVKRIEQYIFTFIQNPPKDIIISPLAEDGTPKMTIGKLGFFEREERGLKDDTKDYPELSILLYQTVFNAAIKEGNMQGNMQGNMLSAGPGVLLAMRIGIITLDQLKYPMMIQLLNTYLIQLGSGWWKECLKQYKVVP